MTHTPQEIRKKQTRQQLMEAAIATFTKKGYFGTTSKDIAKEAGVSIGSFYKYFVDKKAILLEILNNYIDESLMNQHPSDAMNSNQPLDIKSLVRHLDASHPFTEGFYYQVTLLSKTDDEIKEVYNQYQQKIDLYIIKHLERLNLNKSHEELNIIATFIYSLIESAIHMIAFQKLDEDKVYFELFKLLDVYLTQL